MKILVSGSHGLVGSALLPALHADGIEVLSLVRSEPRAGLLEVKWDPSARQIDSRALEGLDAVVHLAGENLANGRWTAARKVRIRDSRVRGTKLLAEALSRVSQRPRVLISASAVGYYGSRGDEVLTEDSSAGNGFLAGVCQEWEAATAAAANAGIRVVHLRFGVILSPRGGALRKMLLPFRLGFGGRIGNGNQYWSWISLEDCVAAIRHVLRADSLRGAVNVVSPQPVTNREFTTALGRVLGRPAWLPAPAFAVRIALGEMADEALLASTRVVPRKLEATNFSFQDQDLEAALRRLLPGG